MEDRAPSYLATRNAGTNSSQCQPLDEARSPGIRPSPILLLHVAQHTFSSPQITHHDRESSRKCNYC